MNSISPVLTEKEVHSERVMALEQPGFYPIIVARVRYADNTPGSIVRFKFTEKEKAAIAQGADLIVDQPHYMPLGLQLAFPGEYPLKFEE